jgi:hypothetical protein
MASQKTKRKRPAASEPEARVTGAPTGGMLRLRKDPRYERRYEPRSGGAVWVSVLAMSIGSVVLGAGVYGQWLRGVARPEITEPSPYALYLLVAGALVVGGVLLFGPRPARAIRVGAAGIGVEKDATEVERIEWRDVTRILFGGDVLTFQGPGAVIAIPLKQQPDAAARAYAEAKRRIPAKLEDVDGATIPKPSDDDGEELPLEKPQLAGARCKASDELIAFEKDARLCGLCGEVYHKAHVPERCVTCDAALK